MWTRLDNRELATVMAALRMWQRVALDEKSHVADIAEYLVASNDGDMAPMAPDEIDKLCERLTTDNQAKPEYIEAARGLYAADSNDDIEVDDDAASSRDDAEDAFGTWVMGWLFVLDSEVENEADEDEQEGVAR